MVYVAHDKLIIEFQQLYKKHFGIDLSRQDALSKYTRLLRTVEIIYKPMTVQEYNNLQKRAREQEKSNGQSRIFTREVRTKNIALRLDEDERF